MDSKETVPVNVTIDINRMLEAYNKTDFMKLVFVEAITKNPQLFTEAISNYIIMEFMQTELGIKTKESIKAALQVKTTQDELSKNRDFGRALDSLLKEELLANRAAISQKVKNVIDHPGFKERTSNVISETVKHRVNAVLGEVCDGCDRDLHIY